MGMASVIDGRLTLLCVIFFSFSFEWRVLRGRARALLAPFTGCSCQCPRTNGYLLGRSACWLFPGSVLFF